MEGAQWLNACVDGFPVSCGSYRAEIDCMVSLLQLSTTSFPSVSASDLSLTEQLEPLMTAMRELAETYRTDPEALLLMLRELEGLHRELQEGPFRSSLPGNRQRLYALLQTMEKSGGWPYIPRLQLRTFIGLLDQDSMDMAA